MKKGKVVSIKREWVVRGVSTTTGATMNEIFPTRDRSRRFMRVLKGMSRAWVDVKMYRTSEVVFGDGQIFISMVKAR